MIIQTINRLDFLNNSHSPDFLQRFEIIVSFEDYFSVEKLT